MKLEELSKLRQQVILFDLDGCLCRGDVFTNEECLNTEPIENNIKIFNELAKNNFLVVYTARRDFLIESTLIWLKKHGVNFHSISNFKTPSHYYIDDRCINIKEL